MESPPPILDKADTARLIETAGTEIVRSCRRAPDAEVASCPGWTAANLTAHVAQVHLWAAGLMAGGDPGPLAEVPAGGDVSDWADAARAELVRAVHASDPQREVWTFIGPRPASWWWRRQVNETAVHAWDATAGSAASWSIPEAVAADALDEVLSVFLPRRWGHKTPTWGEGRTVHLHRTDGEGEWLVRIAADPSVERRHAKGDVAVRAPITDLMLWSIGRRGLDHPGIELFGDAALARAWTDNVRI